ncbi:MAG TPA: zinc ribbon domain-containing protein [Candidatus Limnocylindria bacterium]|nr:zinc ribbon domain-containing protein [Candidatus Limnocylindria bacterium]
MTGDTVECFNCGRPNPGWAQVCRSCGVPLVAARSASAPTGPFPTDQASLISMGAAIAAVLVAVLLGFLLSSMSPSTPTVGFATPTPSPRASISLRPSASAVGSVPAAPVETPVPTPALPGTLTFGTALDQTTRTVTAPTSEFTPQSGGFAHSIAFPAAYGADTISEEVAMVAADGTETIVQSRQAGTFAANPAATVIGLSAPIGGLYADWGVGTFVMRVYRGEEKVAEGTFTLNP